MAQGSSQLQCRRALGFVLVLLCSISHRAQSRSNPGDLLTPLQRDGLDGQPGQQLAVGSGLDAGAGASLRSLKFLVPSPSPILPYHNGPILSAVPALAIYLIWYGSFSPAQQSVVTDLFASFSPAQAALPTVGSWWNVTSNYKDSSGTPVSPTVALAAETALNYTVGMQLTVDDIQTLVVESLAGTFPSDPNGLYLVLTAVDVAVEPDFCYTSCGSHSATQPTAATTGRQLPFAWVGNPAGSGQCEGLCAWPFANAAYGPPGQEPLLPPNGDVGIDGMVINIGVILAGAATDPFATGFFQGDASAPLEAASACAGIYGTGAYAGYPGQLLVDAGTGASYNVNGVNGRKFLLPAIWNPLTLACTPP